MDSFREKGHEKTFCHSLHRCAGKFFFRRRKTRRRARQGDQDRRAVCDVRTGFVLWRTGQARHRVGDRAGQQGRNQRLQARGSVRGFGMQSAPRDAGSQAALGAIQAAGRARRRVLGRHACNYAAHGAGEGAVSQRRLLLDQSHRSRQPVDVSHHAQRGHAGRRHLHQCLQAPQRAHGSAALRKHQCRNR